MTSHILYAELKGIKKINITIGRRLTDTTYDASLDFSVSHGRSGYPDMTWLYKTESMIGYDKHILNGLLGDGFMYKIHWDVSYTKEE